MGTEALELYKELYIFTMKKKRKKTVAELLLEKQLAYFFHNLYSWPAFNPTSTLTFNLSYLPFSIFCCVHMYVVSHMCILLASFCRWGKMWFLLSDTVSLILHILSPTILLQFLLQFSFQLNDIPFYMYIIFIN